MKPIKGFLCMFLILLGFTGCITHTPIPAPEPIIEATATPSITPQVITASNVAQLREMANYGDGFVMNLVWGQNDQFYFVTTAGIEAYSDLGNTLRYRIQSDVRIQSAALTHDGTRLVGCTSTEVMIWDSSNGSLIQSQNIQNPEDNQLQLLISPDDSIIALRGYQKVILMNSSLEILSTIYSSQESIINTVVEFSPVQNELFIGFYNQNTRLPFISVYDTQSIESIRTIDVSTFSEINSSITSFDFIENGNKILINLSNNNFLYVLDSQTGEKLREIPKNRVQDKFKLSPNSTILAQTTYDDLKMVTEKIDLCDWNTQNLLITLTDTEVPYRYIHQFAFSPDEKYILTASVYESSVRLWDITTGNVIKRFDGYFGDVSSFDLSPDGNTLVFSQFSSMIYSLNTETGEVAEFYEYSYSDNGQLLYPSVFDVHFSPDGQYLTVVTSDNVYALSVNNLSILFDSRQNLSEKCSWNAVPSSDGRILVMSCLGGDKIIETNTWQERTDLRISPDDVYSNLKGISSNGRELIFTIPETMKIGRWDIYNNSLIAEIPFFTTDTRGLVFSPDGQWLVMGAENRLCLYSVYQNYQEVACVDGGMSYNPVFSRDSSLLITGRAFFDVTSGTFNEVKVPAIHSKFGPRISQDGKLLVSINNNGTFSVWQVFGSYTTTDSNLETVPPSQTAVENLMDDAIEPTATATDTATMTVEPTLAAAYEVVTKISPIDGKTMVYVPQGEFIMGGENYKDNPMESTTVSAFWIDQTEVTNQEFARFLNEKGNLTEDGSLWYGSPYREEVISHLTGSYIPASGLEKYPVTDVTWYGAIAYCEWAGKRMPTQKEWEKAARGVDGRLYAWGNDAKCGDANLDDQPKSSDNDQLAFDQENCDGYELAAPVMSFPKDVSPYGAYDMTGNVFEWGQDWTDHKLNDANSGYNKLVKGGSFDSGYDFILYNFGEGWPRESWPSIGFRCVSNK